MNLIYRKEHGMFIHGMNINNFFKKIDFNMQALKKNRITAGKKDEKMHKIAQLFAEPWVFAVLGKLLELLSFYRCSKIIKKKKKTVQ